MQSVQDAFSVEEADSTRIIATSAMVSWKKSLLTSIHLFTIGSSKIGGLDTIAGPTGINSQWNNYQYTDESSHVLQMSFERGLSLPLGGLTKAIADVRLDNTSGRYTPRYVGGTNQELYTAVLPRRPIQLNAGFNYGGINNMIPQFVGILDRQPAFDMRNKTVDMSASDFIGFLQNRDVDQSSMYTSVRTDVAIANALTQLGYSTAQYDLDPGLNIIKFALFDTGTKWGTYIDDLVKSEYGHMYQDETGLLRFDNRQKWAQYPYFNVQRVITTAQVIDQTIAPVDHIVNIVEVTATPREVQDLQVIWQITAYAGGGVVTLPPNANTEVWASYNDPIFEVDAPQVGGATSAYLANTVPDGTGVNMTNSVSLKGIQNFAQSSKMVFSNSSSQTIYLTQLDIWGRPARKTGNIYYRGKNGSSVTAYEEQPVSIFNDYIQDASWAETLAELILTDFAHPEKLQEITVRAVPELQLGDLISWQGHYWRIWDIKTQIDPSNGFIQHLKLLQRAIVSYFRIGYSSIGGGDQISP